MNAVHRAVIPGARAPRRAGRRTAWPRTPALVRPRPGVANQAIVSAGGRVFIVAIGRGGIASLKREGDGATPRGRFRPLAALTRGARVLPAGTLPLPWRAVRPTDGWCDDRRSGRYNCWMRLPAAPSHEHLAREDGLYDMVVVTDHNQRPRVAGLGSAIFIHLARPGMTPTEGCLAFTRRTWQRQAVPLGPFLIGVEPRPCR